MRCKDVEGETACCLRRYGEVLLQRTDDANAVIRASEDNTTTKRPFFQRKMVGETARGLGSGNALKALIYVP